MTTRQVDAPDITRCFICEDVNPDDVVFCRTCGAPMAVARDAAAERRLPRIVCVVGESHVGKTVYLGCLLDMLARRAGDIEAVPKSPSAVDLSQVVIDHMLNRRFPPETPLDANQWRWAYYQVARRGRGSHCVDLLMPDVPGDVVAAEVEAPRSSRVVRDLLNKSAGLLLLVDGALAASGSAQPDFFATKLLSYFDSMHAGRAGRRITTPVAVVMCKSDHCSECFENPREFARGNLNRLWTLCENRFDHAAFFATSVVGSLGYVTTNDGNDIVPVPLHTALRGVREPFEWVLDQL